MFKIFSKKNEESKEKSYKKPEEDSLKVEANLEKQKEIIKPRKEEVVEIKPEIQDEVTKQSIVIGLDMKKEVETFSKAFFNSRNKTKYDAYLKFQHFLDSLPIEKKRELEAMTYLEFKEKEGQISTVLKNGFAQHISKGANLDDENRKTIDMVFGDIKKLPSRGHRYWYYKIYIWQKTID